MKKCSKCDNNKNFTDFTKSKSTSSGYNYVCKDCVKLLYTSKFVYCPKIGKNSRLKKAYGITLHDYNYMLYKQNNSCAICGLQNKERYGLHVDHCHHTGKIRGLLCSNCNSGIGNLRDNITLLYKAIEYLEKAVTL